MAILENYYKRYQNIPLVARAALWFVASSMLQKGIAFITIPIFTRIMLPVEYGLYSTFISWESIIAIFCTLNMENCIYVNLYTNSKTDQEKNDSAISLLSLSGIITISLFFLYLVFHNFLNNFITLPFAMVCLLFAQILFQPSVNFWSMRQRFEYKYVILVVITLLMVILNAVLGIFFVLLSKANQAYARVFSIVLVQVIFGGLFYFYFFYISKKVFLIQEWKHALKVQLPLLPHGLSITILNSSDRILINNLVGSAEAGIYSVAYSAGYIVGVFKNSIIDALRPWMYNKIKEKNFDAIRSMSNSIIIIIVIITIFFSAFGPEVIQLMAPSQYYEAIYVIPPVAASTFFTFLYNLFSIIGMYYEKTKLIMTASVFGAFINIILNLILIPIFGYLVAAYTTLLCFILFSLAHYYIMVSINRTYLGNVRFFDSRFICIMAVLVLGITIFFEVIYQYPFIRYIIIVCFLFFLFVKRSWLISTIKELINNQDSGVRGQ